MARIWDKKGVPHSGWSFVRTVAHEDATQVCKMCGQKNIRYIDIVSHPDHEDLKVGQDCSKIMCMFPNGALRLPVKEIIFIVPNRGHWQVMCKDERLKVEHKFESLGEAGLWAFENIIWGGHKQ